MEPNEKPKLDIKRVLITAGIVLLAAGIVGGTTWYLMDKSAREIKTANDESIAALQKQIDDHNTKTNTTTSTTLPTTTETVVAGTENWLTYTGQNSGYTIEYPNGWVYDGPTASVDIVTFHAKLGEQWQFQIETTSTSKTLQQNADTEIAAKTQLGYTVNSSRVTVGGQSAVQLTLTHSNGVYGDAETLVVYKGKLYTILQGSGSDANENKMVKTFKFN